MQTILLFALVTQQNRRRAVFACPTASRTWHAGLVSFVMQQPLRVIASRWINRIGPRRYGILAFVIFALQTQPMHVIVQVIFQTMNFVSQFAEWSQADAVVCIATRHCKCGCGGFGSEQAGPRGIDGRQPDLTAATATNNSQQSQYRAPPDDGGTQFVNSGGSDVSIHWSVAKFVGLGC